MEQETAARFFFLPTMIKFGRLDVDRGGIHPPQPNQFLCQRK
jgi:hypothetical protein